MKKLFLVLVMLGMFTAVSFAEVTPPVATNAAVDTTAPDQGMKKAKHHKKAKAQHKKAQKEAKEDKKDAAKEAVNAVK